MISPAAQDQAEGLADTGTVEQRAVVARNLGAADPAAGGVAAQAFCPPSHGVVMSWRVAAFKSPPCLNAMTG